MTKNFTQLQTLFSQNTNENTEREKISMQNYMRNLFPYFGIKATPRRDLQNTILVNYKTDKAVDYQFVKDLWAGNEREFQSCALDYLRSKKKFLKPDDLPFLKELILTKSWWDSVDVIAPYFVGEIAKNNPEIVNILLNDWAVSDNFWLRRSAILFQLMYKKETDTKILEEIILKNNTEKEFFVKKAIGWVLREYSKTNPAWVRDFLARVKLEPLSVREASKYI